MTMSQKRPAFQRVPGLGGLLGGPDTGTSMRGVEFRRVRRTFEHVVASGQQSRAQAHGSPGISLGDPPANARKATQPLTRSRRPYRGAYSMVKRSRAMDVNTARQRVPLASVYLRVNPSVGSMARSPRIDTVSFAPGSNSIDGLTRADPRAHSTSMSRMGSAPSCANTNVLPSIPTPLVMYWNWGVRVGRRQRWLIGLNRAKARPVAAQEEIPRHQACCADPDVAPTEAPSE